MSPALRRALIATSIILAIAIGLAFAGSSNSQQIGGFPVFAICIILAFLIHWIAFIPAMFNQTEKYFDLTGGISNVALPLVATLLTPNVDIRGWLLAFLIVVWGGRLGMFLFRRIQAAGHDSRFDEMKTQPPRFFVTWSLSALWSSLSLAAALAAITSFSQKPLGIIAIIGLLVWIAGFAIEVVSDQQKTAFKADPKNKGKFIDSGLWAWSRHPNYFGEIVLWIGIAIIALPVLQGWQLATLISPIFVIVLLTRISGLPMLEDKADKKWGGQPDYEAYKANTPILIPRPPVSN